MIFECPPISHSLTKFKESFSWGKIRKLAFESLMWAKIGNCTGSPGIDSLSFGCKMSRVSRINSHLIHVSVSLEVSLVSIRGPPIWTQIYRASNSPDSSPRIRMHGIHDRSVSFNYNHSFRNDPVTSPSKSLQLK